MMARTQIALEPEVRRRARQRASDLGVSLAEYLRRLVARDLGNPPAKADPALLFDLGASRQSDIAKHKDAMIAEAITATGAASFDADFAIFRFGPNRRRAFTILR